MARGDFKISGITPDIGNIKVGNTDVKQIYQGDVLVWPPNIDPPYFTTPTERQTSYTSPPIESGDTFTYTANAKSDYYNWDELTITIDTLPQGWTISNLKQNPLTGDAQVVISGIVVDDNIYGFTLRVTDPDGKFAEQKISVNGVIPTEKTFISIVYDTTSMGDDEIAAIQNDLINKPYEDPQGLRYYLQDFYATAETESEGNTDPETNGRDKYTEMVSIVGDGSENPLRAFNGFEINNAFSANNYDSLFIFSLLDESVQGSRAGLVPGASKYLYLGDWNPSLQYVKVPFNSNDGVISTFVSYPTTKGGGDPRPGIWQLSYFGTTPPPAGTPPNDPSVSNFWKDVSPNSREGSVNGIPYGWNKAGKYIYDFMANMNTLKKNLDTAKEIGLGYRAVLLGFNPTPVNPYLNPSCIQPLYDALNEPIDSRFYREQNSLKDYKDRILIGNPEAEDNKVFGYELLPKVDTSIGFYTKLIVDSLIKAGVPLKPYKIF